jgi:hypothetical protein
VTAFFANFIVHYSIDLTMSAVGSHSRQFAQASLGTLDRRARRGRGALLPAVRAQVEQADADIADGGALVHARDQRKHRSQELKQRVRDEFDEVNAFAVEHDLSIAQARAAIASTDDNSAFDGAELRDGNDAMQQDESQQSQQNNRPEDRAAQSADRDRELPINISSFARAEWPFAELFELGWDDNERIYQFVCCDVNNEHEPGQVVKAWRDPKARPLRPKVFNLRNHITTKHNRPIIATWWESLASDDDPDSVRAALRRAAADHWSVAQFVAWHDTVFDKSKKNCKPGYDWASMLTARVIAKWKIDCQRRRPLSSLASTLRMPSSSNKRQRTIDEMQKKLSSRRDVVGLAIKELILVVGRNLPFQLAEWPEFRALIATEPGQALPNRQHVRAVLDVAFDVAMETMEKKLERAPAFSIMFDAWTSRGLFNSYLGVIYTFIDENFRLQYLLLDVIGLGVQRHTANVLALELAARIDIHTTDRQFFYGSVTDGAKNVMSASQKVVNQMLDVQKQIKSGIGALAAVDIWGEAALDTTNEAEADEAQNDESLVLEASRDLIDAMRDAEPTAGIGLLDIDHLTDVDTVAIDSSIDGTDADEGSVAPLDKSRGGTCIDHGLNLAVLGMVKDSELLKTALKKVDRVVAATSRSTRCQQQLNHAARKLGLKPKKLIRRAPTRWNSVHDCIDRFLEMKGALAVLLCNGSFDKTAAFVDFPTQSEMALLEATKNLLATVVAVVRALETRECTLPHVPYFVHLLLTKLDDNDDIAESNRVRAVRASLRRQLKKRLGKHLSDATQPSLLAALLFPCHAQRLREMLDYFEAGSSEKVIGDISENLWVWMEQIVQYINNNNNNNNSQTDADLGEDDAADLPLFARKWNEEVSSATTLENELQIAKKELTKLIQKLFSPAVKDSFQMPSFSSTLPSPVERAADQLQRFFATFPEVNRPYNVMLIRYVMSLPAATAGVESVFSAGGLIDAPRRNRLSSETMEKLLIVHQFMKMGHAGSLDEFGQRIIERMKN